MPADSDDIDTKCVCVCVCVCGGGGNRTNHLASKCIFIKLQFVRCPLLCYTACVAHTTNLHTVTCPLTVCSYVYMHVVCVCVCVCVCHRNFQRARPCWTWCVAIWTCWRGTTLAWLSRTRTTPRSDKHKHIHKDLITFCSHVICFDSLHPYY